MALPSSISRAAGAKSAWHLEGGRQRSGSPFEPASSRSIASTRTSNDSSKTATTSLTLNVAHVVCLHDTYSVHKPVNPGCSLSASFHLPSTRCGSSTSAAARSCVRMSGSESTLSGTASARTRIASLTSDVEARSPLLSARLADAPPPPPEKDDWTISSCRSTNSSHRAMSRGLSRRARSSSRFLRRRRSACDSPPLMPRPEKRSASVSEVSARSAGLMKPATDR